MKALLRLLILAILVAGVMALMLGLGRYWSPLTVAHWKGQLEAVPDQSAGSLLGRVGSSGDMGIAILVEALASPRERIARAARQSLLQQIDQWKTLSAAGSSPKFALLAHELADRQAELGPAGRHDAAELAIPILQGPLDPGTEEAVEVIACCEKVLQAAQADPPSAVADALARRAEQDVASAAAAALPDAGRWPAAAVQEPSLIPGLLPGVDSPKPPSAAIAALPKKTDLSAADPAIKRIPFPDSGKHAADAAVHQASAVEKPPGEPADELKGVESLELLQRVCSPVEETAAAARTELSRRGFTEVHFDLARRMFNADPAVRKELARQLPELRSIDAAPWLIQLSRDSDPGVRLTAITLMATSGDPLLLEQVARIAGEDPDQRIRDQVTRIELQRNDAGQRGMAAPARPASP